MSDDGLDHPPTGLSEGRRSRDDLDPLGPLPQLTRRQVAVETRLGIEGPAEAGRLVEGWNRLLGGRLLADRFAIQWRAAGLRRPGVVAHLLWPRFRTRVGFGVDPPLAHAIVDLLLGHERTAAEARLQVSPVEWGVLTFVIAAGLERLEEQVGPIGPWDLTIDRVGPDPFDTTDLGPVVTWRWRVRVGPITGSARLWFPESLLTTWLSMNDHAVGSQAGSGPDLLDRHPQLADLASEWQVEAGQITFDPAADLAEIAAGRLYLLDDAPLTGTTAHPAGLVTLTQRGPTTRGLIRAELKPSSAGLRLVVTSPPSQTSTSVNAPMPDNLASQGPEAAAPAATVTVELGRLHLALHQLAALAPGDVLDLNRQAGDPVDLTANGRLIARGELVQVDTELGVRIIQSYL